MIAMSAGVPDVPQAAAQSAARTSAEKRSITGDTLSRRPEPPTRIGYAFSAACTRAVVNGTRRMRTPVASKMALATAASIGLHTVSPAP